MAGFLTTRFLLLSCSASLFSLVDSLRNGVGVGVGGSSSSSCGVMDSILDGQKYHTDASCGGREAYNAFKDSLHRGQRYQYYKETQSYYTVPNQRTVYCPLSAAGDGQPKTLQRSDHGIGMDTVWFVENTASVPVVVSYINDAGIEVSAQNPDIIPAHHDPSSIIQPGSWMSIYTYEGHVFHVREYKHDDDTVGDLLLQHRVGLIPVGKKLASKLICSWDDPEPIVNNTRSPEYSRTPSTIMRPCNTLDIGFRNMARCPIHGYYVASPQQVHHHHNSADDGGDSSSSCIEMFKFHLGVQQKTTDYMWQWDSETKFEGTFIGHTFSFRLAENPSILVDQITIEPTKVTSCPKNKKHIIKTRTSGAPIHVSLDKRTGPKDIHDEMEQQKENILDSSSSIPISTNTTSATTTTKFGPNIIMPGYYSKNSSSSSSSSNNNNNMVFSSQQQQQVYIVPPTGDDSLSSSYNHY